MKIQHLILSLSLACSAFFIAPASNAADTPDNTGGGAMCYRNNEGFLVSAPAGWVNHPKVASDYELCAMYTPQGGSFEKAEIVL
ncbi:MAG: hypothetical protein ACRCWR_09220, partial [Saezia sp.]